MVHLLSKGSSVVDAGALSQDLLQTLCQMPCQMCPLCYTLFLQLVEPDREVRSGRKLGGIIQDRDPAGIHVIISHRYVNLLYLSA